jgi:hypothetical protein
MGLSSSTLTKFRRVEPWIIAVLLGKLPKDEDPEVVSHFLDVHAGITEPNSETERMWLAYWDRKPPMIADLKEIYLRLAERVHCSFGSDPSVVYDDVVGMYQIASWCGSVKAARWLREQNLEPIRENSVWRSVYLDRWDVNG